MLIVDITVEEVIKLIASSNSSELLYANKKRRNCYLVCYYLSKGLSIEDIAKKMNYCKERIKQLKENAILRFYSREIEESCINYRLTNSKILKYCRYE